MAAHAFQTIASSTLQPQSISNARRWAGCVLSTVAVLFLTMDGGMKLFKPAFVVKTTVQLGYPESTIVGIGIALLGCTVLYLIPRTSVWGTILLTGYLGGAVASKVRIGASLFDISFALVFAAIVWGGLVLRDKRLQHILFGK